MKLFEVENCHLNLKIVKILKFCSISSTDLPKKGKKLLDHALFGLWYYGKTKI